MRGFSKGHEDSIRMSRMSKFYDSVRVENIVTTLK